MNPECENCGHECPQDKECEKCGDDPMVEGDDICVDCHYETKWDLPEDIDPLGANNE